MDRNDSRRLVRILLPYVALWLALAVMLGVFAAYEIRKSRTQALDTARAELGTISRLASEHALQTLSGVDRALATFQAFHDHRMVSASLSDLLTAIADDDDGDGRISVFDRDGHFVASSRTIHGDASAIDISDRPYFIEVRDDPARTMHIGTPVEGRLGGRRVVPLVRRLSTDDGTFDGVLLSAVSPSHLVTMYRSIRFGESAQVGLVRDDGLVYARSTTEDANGASLAGVLRNALSARRGDGHVYARVDIEGSAVLAALQEIPGTRLSAFALLSESEALAGHTRVARNMIGLALFALAGFSLPLFIVGRRTVHDLRHRSELERRYAVERRRARTDPLTAVANRIAFDDHVERCNRALMQDGTPFVLAFIDLDRFKALNDSRGHLAGDSALRRVARTLQSTVRGTDLVARLGGDEFAVLMPGATAEGSPRICGKLHAALLAAAASADLGIGFSIGVVAFEDAPAEPRVITALADRLMYDVKSAGGEGVRYGVYRRDGLHLANERPADPIRHAAD